MDIWGRIISLMVQLLRYSSSLRLGKIPNRRGVRSDFTITWWYEHRKDKRKGPNPDFQVWKMQWPVFFGCGHAKRTACPGFPTQASHDRFSCVWTDAVLSELDTNRTSYLVQDCSWSQRSRRDRGGHKLCWTMWSLIWYLPRGLVSIPRPNRTSNQDTDN